MRIDQSSLAYIQNVVKTAEIVKIGNIIIEPARVRAVDENRTVVLFQDTNVPAMPFGSIGLNRIDVFSSRFDIAKSIDNFEIDVVVENEGTNPFARALTMKAKGIKIDYRCANPATIQAPKGLNDPIKYKIRMIPEAVMYMQKGQSAMGAEDVTLIGGADGVTFELTDINSDKLVYKFADFIEKMQNDDATDAKFTHKYPLKTLQALFKHNPDGNFYLTTRGMLKVIVNNLDLFVLPKV